MEPTELIASIRGQATRSNSVTGVIVPLILLCTTRLIILYLA
jgi:hypothetical protein